ncbi:MAG TPA: D-isomer specific 2-hydroxyacid dehydrogenase family protein [Candidatus Limnocylindrales bacterium]|jgi:phosphoglycerate dehydrogenase-like enzyme|nr:D-isomer specific 2-hydroxyacid dehydrogenase family protein [Candidatus Limnocylindrales bacterium]
MRVDVLCLRPEADFRRVGVMAPDSLKVVYRAPNDVDVEKLMKQARAMMIPAVGPKLPKALFENATVKFVQVTGAGLDRLDLGFLKERGIAVANVPGGSNEAVAEYAVTTASMLLRRFAWADAEIRRGDYRDFRARMIADSLQGLDGLNVGIIGFGTIGLAVASAFHKRGCLIIYHDPAPRDPQIAEAIGAKSHSLEEILQVADVVSLHVPLLPETTGMIGRRELALMKPGAILIQGSRGGVVDEAALAEALEEGRLGGAAVDVYSTEPPVANNPLLALKGEAAHRIFLTPHIAGVTRQSTAFLCRAAWRNVERFFSGKETPLDLVS